MKHKYLSNDDLNISFKRAENEDLELITMVLVAFMMAKDQKSFKNDLRYFLASQTREGITQHRVSSPNASLECQKEFEEIIVKMMKDVLTSLQDSLTITKLKEV